MVQSYASADMVVLAVIERAHVEVGGLPAQDWSLRVTLVYRREGTNGCWRIGMPTPRRGRQPGAVGGACTAGLLRERVMFVNHGPGIIDLAQAHGQAELRF